jgi:hypothetical protein
MTVTEEPSPDISIDCALEHFRHSVNRPDTIFSTNHWLIPKLEQLRTLLSDPVTKDHAQALDDVLYGRCQMRELIEWLESALGLSWSDFIDTREQRRREALWAEWLGGGGPRPGQKHYANRRLVHCPKCGSHTVVAVMYGHPSDIAEEAARQGALAMGGCCIPSPLSEMNRWCCKQCKFRWPGEFEEEWPRADSPTDSSKT